MENSDNSSAASQQYRYLLSFIIGPVQSFIAAARRTGDLWFGSRLLSELAKAAADCALNNAAELIFPHSEQGARKIPGDITVANKVLLRVDAGDPRAFVANMKVAVKKCWESIVTDVLKNGGYDVDAPPDDAPLVRMIFDAQLNDFPDTYAAWVRSESDDSYAADLKKLETLLAARKASRVFRPSPFLHGRLRSEKSSLDGLRESVLRPALAEKWRRRWGLGDGEELDVVGLVKRIGGRNSEYAEQFTPLTRIAVDPWVRKVKNGSQAQPLLQSVCELLKQLQGSDLTGAVVGNGGIYSDLPYDGQLLYRARLVEELRRYRAVDAGRDPAGALLFEKLKNLESELNKKAGLWNLFGQPDPYLAILAADGDRMGGRIQDIAHKKHIAGHQCLSRELNQFALDVPALVRSYRGHAVYCGGDDALVMVPVDKAVRCAKALSDHFAQIDTSPTLSVGIAVGHMLEPLSGFIARARSTLLLAKGDGVEKLKRRNALAISLKPRAGAELCWRGQWSDRPDPQARLKEWVEAFKNGDLGRGTPYALRQLLDRFRWLEGRTSGDKRTKILTPVLERMLARRSEDNMVKKISERLCDRDADFNTFIDELLIARRLS